MAAVALGLMYVGTGNGEVIEAVLQVGRSAWGLEDRPGRPGVLAAASATCSTLQLGPGIHSLVPVIG